MKNLVLKFIILFVLAIIIVCCSGNSKKVSTLNSEFCLPLEAISMTSDLNRDSTKWIQVENPKAVAIIIHGLNMRPNKMDDLSEYFHQKNIAVLQVALRGHIKSIDQEKEWANLQSTDWSKEAFVTYCQAMQTAQKKDLPLYLVGYSLGGALLSDLLLRHPQNFYAKTKQILLAPAISLPWYTSLIKISRLFGSKAIIPSFNIESYKAFRGTSVSGYNALFDITDHFENATSENYKSLDIPTLVLMDPKDELVSFRGINKIISKNKLSNWKLETIDNNSSQLPGKYHHLIVDKESLGIDGWQRLTKLMDSFI